MPNRYSRVYQVLCCENIENLKYDGYLQYIRDGTLMITKDIKKAKKFVYGQQKVQNTILQRLEFDGLTEKYNFRFVLENEINMN